MNHLILTRFNILCSRGVAYKDESWLRERVRLFYKFCLPSVERQVNQNFRWLLFVDSESPSWLCEEFDQISARYKNVEWIFSSNYTEARNGVKNSVRREDFPLLTTRLDNDDIIFPNFTEVVQQHTNQWCTDLQPLIISFPYGYTFWVRHNKFKRLRVLGNQFISYVEHNFPVKTVLRSKHRNIVRFNLTRSISVKPMWCHIWHEGNYSHTQKDHKKDNWVPLNQSPELLNLVGC